jgi:transcriptional regulator GlxA family with amidase domain
VTPARYYMECRITHARQLIQQSNLSIFEISIACGFVSSAHFSRTYNRFFGKSPIDSRRTFQA